MKIKVLTAGLLAFAVLPGCLETRSGVKEQEEKQVIRKQVATLQQTTADVNQRFTDLEEDLRKHNGRFEATDARITQIKDRAEKNDFALEAKVKEQDQKFVAFREELEKMKAELNESRASLASAQEALQAIAASGSSGGSSGASGSASSAGSGKGEKGSSDKTAFEAAETKYEAKAYRDAIFAYQEYRKSHPKGKSVIAATYKTGLCFQELGMAEDAKPFYEEVIAKAPKSKEADRSRARLKAMGKKK